MPIVVCKVAAGCVARAAAPVVWNERQLVRGRKDCSEHGRFRSARERVGVGAFYTGRSVFPRRNAERCVNGTCATAYMRYSTMLACHKSRLCDDEMRLSTFLDESGGLKAKVEALRRQFWGRVQGEELRGAR